jgi:hypothetical protein
MAAAQVALANITLGSAAATVTFSSIPATYRDLRLVISGSGASASGLHYLQINADTASNYSSVRMYGDGASTGSDTATSGGARIGNIYGSDMNGIIDIFDYSATDKHKTMLSRNNIPTGLVIADVNRWASTAAVTSVKVFPGAGSYNTGMTFSLFGIVS